MSAEQQRKKAFPFLLGLVALLILALARVVADLPFGPLNGFLEKWSYNVVLVGASGACIVRSFLIRKNQRAWLLLGISMLVWTLGNIYYTVVLWDATEIPVPSPSDVFWVLFYPGAYISVIRLMRDRVVRSSGMWLDGVIGGLTVGAIGAAVVFDKVQQVTGGSSISVATNLSYPLADLVLVSLVVMLAGLSGWRLGRSGWMLLGSLALFGAFDSLYLFQVAAGTWVPGNLFEAGWPAAMILMAAAAWAKPSGQEPRSAGELTFAIPFIFSVISLGVLVYDHFDRVNPLALTLSTAAIGSAIVRMWMTFRENASMLETSRAEATTDSLTGLSNRRALMMDLQEACASTSQTVLLIFDLDGFKDYNDRFGHPAGDDLLRRLGRSLTATVGDTGTVYRMGGDEFCALIAKEGLPEMSAARLAISLSESGEGFTVTSSFGWALLPDEGNQPADALRISDRRLYANKSGGRAPAGRQSTDVLLTALAERDSTLQTHLTGVAVLARTICERLALSEEDSSNVCIAAELHDVGKVAIPDVILNKPGSLKVDERRFIERHTIIGQKILTAAPALIQASQLVRSSHERWDGKGYPDGLAGDEIPLGARIVAVCDAFDAMTSDRPYRRSTSVGSALEELKRCAGSQFDPSVVDLFVSVVSTSDAWNPAPDPNNADSDR